MESPAVILVRPQMAENIGAAARAMCNFGLDDLRIVAPRDGWPNVAADNMAAGAMDKITVRIFDTLPKAMADCHYVYATSARERDMVKPALALEDAAADAQARQAKGQKTALAFGPERAGLDNDETALCHTLLHIDTNPDFSSLNLGQAVLLCAYALSGTSDSGITEKAEPIPAPHEKMEEFLQRLESELEEKKFFRSSGLKPTMKRNIRNIFTRAEPTEQEVRTLHGILSALLGNKIK